MLDFGVIINILFFFPSILSHIHGGMSLLDNVYCTVEKFVPYCIDDLQKYENVLLLRFMVMIHPRAYTKRQNLYTAKANHDSTPSISSTLPNFSRSLPFCFPRSRSAASIKAQSLQFVGWRPLLSASGRTPSHPRPLLWPGAFSSEGEA